MKTANRSGADVWLRPVNSIAQL